MHYANFHQVQYNMDKLIEQSNPNVKTVYALNQTTRCGASSLFVASFVSSRTFKKFCHTSYSNPKAKNAAIRNNM
jgi:hypothetical protein